MNIKLFTLSILLFFVTIFTVSAQEFSAEMRAKFVSDQDAYLADMNLSSQQRAPYEEITRRYDKYFQNVNWSDQSDATKKKRKKNLTKQKNAEMKRLLNDSQYKKYLKRQKEIENNYLE